MMPADHFVSPRLRVPGEHGQTLVHPTATTAATSIQAHDERLSNHGHLLWMGKPWSDIVSAARHDLWTKAVKHTSQYTDPKQINEAAMSRVVLLGHQPELFHPGVWFKNFFVAELAQQLSAISINLLIDNATLDTPAIQVPTGNPAAPQVETIPFDQTVDPIPFELRNVIDGDTFTSFASRVKQATSQWIDDPLVEQLWPQVIEAERSTGKLGLALAQGRHRLEGEWGIHNLEVPLSTLCDSESFFWFLSCIVCQLPRFWEIHNTSLQEYRQAYRVRSKSHPVPTLESDDGWLEAPFWVWSQQDPQRRPLFLRHHDNQIEMTDRAQLTCCLSISNGDDAQSVVEQLTAYRAAGISIRPRALMTTMYARLVLSDLFVHGIGGGRYDQLTDIIVERFFGVAPPDFLTATATLQLPIDLPDPPEQTLRDLESQLREMKFSPERYLFESEGGEKDSNQRLQQLIREKETLIASLKSGQSPTAAAHQSLEGVNEQLQAFLTDSREQLEKQCESLKSASRNHSLLTSREFSFCLFPQKTLCPLLLALSGEGL